LAFALQIVAGIMAGQGTVVLAMGSFKGGTYQELMDYIVKLVLSSMTDMLYIIYTVSGIILFSFIYKKLFKEEVGIKFAGISKNIPATIGGIVLFSIGMQYVCVYLMNALAAAFPSWLEDYINLIETSGLGNNMSFGLALYAIILGPVCEELIFRAVTYSAAKKVMPYYAAIIVQAILFGAYHMNAIQGSYAFVLGLGLGYIMYLYNNIFITIFVHIIFNIVGTFGSELLPIGGDTLITFFIWVLGSLIVTYVSILLLRFGASTVKDTSDYSDI